jgi:antitoxin VapB
LSLNIKNKETYHLARELAEVTGESLTTAVTVALQERLNRVRERRPADLVEQLLAIGRECAARLRESHQVPDHGEFLYDDQGLPK